MKTKVKKYTETSPLEFLLLRDRMGLKKYRKSAARKPEKKEILLRLGLKQMQEKEKDDFIPAGFRKRKLKMPL